MQKHLNVEDILNPVSIEEFIENFIKKEPMHIKGNGKKLQYLMPWKEINSILRHQRMEFPRIRIWKDRKVLPQEKYMRKVDQGEDI